MQAAFGDQIGSMPAFSDSIGEAELQTVATAFLRSRQQIRQEIARLLDEQHECRIAGIRIALTFDERALDVASLPSFIRGSLSGPGKFAGEAALEFTGPFTKAQVEEMVERLPDFAPGACRVTLALEPVRSEAAPSYA